MAAAVAASAGVDRFAHVRKALGGAAFAKVQSARVLVVGAGGIGCELLKNLVLSGFRDIHVVDLDTIDVSNLNRQFLFRRQHVGQSKATVARDAVLAMAGASAAAQPPLRITAAQANVKDESFDAEFFKGFTLVMNALDNLDARRHVNRLCLAAEVPLIESGTQGYLGQTTTIRHHKTECFECLPQPTPKTFAACTIRNTPDRPVHCIHWAKYLFGTLFGPPDEGNLLSDLKLNVADCRSKDDALKVAKQLFVSLYHTEILKQLQVADRWVNRTPPKPLQLDALLADAAKAQPTAAAAAAATTGAATAPGELRDNRVLSVGEQAQWFIDTVVSIATTRRASIGSMDFDKDDVLAMDFVAAASNLRSANFGIALQSRFSAKGIAGNIVHAIATTNAIAAALVVQEAMKVCNAQYSACRTTWIRQSGAVLLQPQALVPPNADCYVCGKALLTLQCNTQTLTLQRLFSDVLKSAGLGMNEPSVDDTSSGKYIGLESDYTEDNPAFLRKTLAELKIGTGSLLAVDDHSQTLQCNIKVQHTDALKEEDVPLGFILSGAAAVAKPTAPAAAPAPASAAAAASSAAAAMADDDDDDVVASSSGAGSSGGGSGSSSNSSGNGSGNGSSGQSKEHNALKRTARSGGGSGSDQKRVRTGPDSRATAEIRNGKAVETIDD